MNDITNLVRARREALGWTQSDLARALGSSPSRICKLEAGDSSVAPTLGLRALGIMGCSLAITIDSEGDPFTEPTLSSEQRRQFSARLLRRRLAERIAETRRVDAGDVEHALFNLTLDPWERLARSFRRSGLARLSAQ